MPMPNSRNVDCMWLYSPLIVIVLPSSNVWCDESAGS